MTPAQNTSSEHKKILALFLMDRHDEQVAIRERAKEEFLNYEEGSPWEEEITERWRRADEYLLCIHIATDVLLRDKTDFLSELTTEELHESLSYLRDPPCECCLKAANEELRIRELGSDYCAECEREDREAKEAPSDE